MTHESSSFWQDRPTLVTGATGLVGAWLVKRLVDHGADVVCLVRDSVPRSELVRSGLANRVTLVDGDIRDQTVVERVIGEYEIDTVMHLAAQTIVTVANRNPGSTFDSNIRGTWAVLEACRRSPKVKQIVVASSDKAYGDHGGQPYTEDLPLRGDHPYDVSKSCADLISRAYAITYGLPVVISRCGNFYGGGDLNWNRVVPGTIRSIVRGNRPIIRSDGQYTRDYVYVEEGAAIYTVLAERLAADRSLTGEAFNFSTGAQMTVLEIVQRILRVMGSDLAPEILNETTNEIRSQYLDYSKAIARLGWQPMFTLDEGLKRTIEWYTAFLGSSAVHV